MFNKYPYTDFHELNLDWILKEIKKMRSELTEFEVINEITFSGAWNITSQYPAWTIVDNGGMGYVSVQPVPAGVQITNTDYWRLIADYTVLIAGLQARIINIENTLAANDINTDTKYAVWFGDSYTEAASLGADQNQRYSTQVSGVLKCTEKNYAKGGCGYVQGADNYLQQLQDAIYDFTINNLDFNDVKYVFVMGSRNDHAADHAAMLTNARDLFRGINTNFPKAKLVVAPLLWDYTYISDEALQNINIIKQNLVNAKNCILVDNAHLWFTGRMSEILYQSGANVHWSLYGHYRAACLLVNILNGGSPYTNSSFFDAGSMITESYGVSAACKFFGNNNQLTIKGTLVSTGAASDAVLFTINDNGRDVQDSYMGEQQFRMIKGVIDSTKEPVWLRVDCSSSKTGDTAADQTCTIVVKAATPLPNGAFVRFEDTIPFGIHLNI